MGGMQIEVKIMLAFEIQTLNDHSASPQVVLHGAQPVCDFADRVEFLDLLGAIGGRHRIFSLPLKIGAAREARRTRSTTWLPELSAVELRPRSKALPPGETCRSAPCEIAQGLQG